MMIHTLIDRSALRVGFAFCLTAIAALGFHRLLPVGPLAATAAAAIVAGVGASVCVGALSRRGTVTVLVVAVPVWLVLVGAAVNATVPESGISALPMTSNIRALLVAAGGGWWTILTTVPPLGADGTLTGSALVAVSAVVALTGLLAAEAAVRTRSVLVVALPPAVLFVLALLAGGPGGDVPVAVALAVAVAALAVLERPAARPALRPTGAKAMGRIAGAVLCVTVVGGSAAVGGAVASAGAHTSYDPRTLASPPTVPATAVNPLDAVSGWLAEPATMLLTVTAVPAPTNAGPLILRLAVLDLFDGLDWSSDATYRTVGDRLPTAQPSGDGCDGTPATTAVTQDVTVGALSAVWLPAAGTAVGVSAAGARVAADADGTILIPAGLHRGLTYSVTSCVPHYTDTQLRYAAPATDLAALALPGTVPAVVTQTALAATAGAAFPYQQALRLADYLRTHETYDPNAAAGHGYGSIAYFLQQSHRGTSEQFAVAFALAARGLGLPTRIAVGLIAPPGSGPLRLTGADVLAWPEVDFAGLGWVPFYPTPQAGRSGGASAPATGESSARRQADQDLLSAPVDQAAGPAAGKPRAGGPADSSRRAAAPAAQNPATSAAVLAAGVALGLIGAYVFGVLGRPALRRRRGRSRTDPARAVYEAWREALTELRIERIDAPRNLTTEQVCVQAAALPPPAVDALRALAACADHAAFSGTATHPALAQEAWARLDGLRSAIRTGIPARRRIVRALAWHALVGGDTSRWRPQRLPRRSESR